MTKGESIIIVVIVILAMLFVVPVIFDMFTSCDGNSAEQFSPHQTMDDTTNIKTEDDVNKDYVKSKGITYDYESLIYDNTTGTIMSGSQFMENTGIVAPLWIPPAWDPDAYGPSAKGDLDPADYENDPRMLYNKCSLSCCSAQYPLPFKADADPFVCDKNGKSKYLASDYTCTNNTGGTGCLCMSEKQADGLQHGYTY
jgi:hypothetical protein